MATVSFDPNGADTGARWAPGDHLSPDAHGALVVPDAALMFRGSYARSGPDLTITGQDGHKLVVPDYFGADHLPPLFSPDGAMLDGDLVAQLAGPRFPGQYAQAGPLAKAAPIGQIETFAGSAVVTHSDGTKSGVAVGSPVFQGDIIETAAGSRIAITFADKTVLSIGEGARMVLDKFAYDPGGSDNSILFNLVHGAFVFVAGLVAPTGDMKIQTPVATMGIRGTTGVARADIQDGTSYFTLKPDPPGKLGQPGGKLGAFDVYARLNGVLIKEVRQADQLLIVRNASGQFEDNATLGLDEKNFQADILNFAFAAHELMLQRTEAGQEPVSPDKTAPPVPDGGPTPDRRGDASDPNDPTKQAGLSPSLDTAGFFREPPIVDLFGRNQLDLLGNETSDRLGLLPNIEFTVATGHTFSPSPAQLPALLTPVPSTATSPVFTTSPVAVAFLQGPSIHASGPLTFSSPTGLPVSLVGTFATVTSVSIGAAAFSLTPAQTAAFANAFSFASWHFDLAIDTTFLAQGQQVVTTVTLVIADSQGATSTQTEAFSVIGLNDTPVVTAPVAGTIAAGASLDLLQGAKDVDAGAILHVASVAIPAGAPLVFDAKTNTLAVDPAAAAYQTLAQGETATFNVTYLVADEFGATTTQSATVTVTGVNDPPTLAPAQGGIIHDTAAPDSFPVPITGQLAGHDPDHNAVLTYQIAGKTPDLAGTTSITTAYGVLTLTADGHYSFAPDAHAIDALAAGVAPFVEIAVQVSDGVAPPVASTLRFDFAGANDTPVITSAPYDLSLSAADAVSGPDGVHASGAVIFTDADTGDHPTATLSAPVLSSTGASTLSGSQLAALQASLQSALSFHADSTWSFDLADSAADVLRPGQAVLADFTVIVDDGHPGGTATQHLKLSIAGAADPTAVTITGPGNDFSGNAALSADGMKVVFESDATNLVQGDANNLTDVFVRDLATGAITRVSLSAAGAEAQAPGGSIGSYLPSISADGTKVAFLSDASNLVAGDFNNATDVFVVDLATHAVTLVSQSQGGVEGNADSVTSFGDQPAFSPVDNRVIAFSSLASNLTADTNNHADVFVKNLATGAVTLVSEMGSTQGNGDSYGQFFSPDGTKIAFFTDSTNFAVGDANHGRDLYVRDLASNTLTLVSGPAGGGFGNGLVGLRAAFSPDGSKIAFQSTSSNLTGSGTTPYAGSDIFIKYLAAADGHGVGDVVRVTNQASGGADSFPTSFSADGSMLLFSSTAPLVAGDANATTDVFLAHIDPVDGHLSQIVRVTPDTSAAAIDKFSIADGLVADGHGAAAGVLYESYATNIVPGHVSGLGDVYFKDLATGVVTLVSAATNTTAIAETSEITTDLFLGTITVANDAPGHTLQLSGADATRFVIRADDAGNEALYLKAHALLDYETQADLAVTVNVVDTATAAVDATQTFHLAVTNVNEAPVSPGGSISATVPERANVAGSMASDTAGGTFTFTDPDLNDTHTVSAALKSASGPLGAVGTFNAALAPDGSGPSPGTVAWEYSVTDSVLDPLAAGQSEQLVYTITIKDAGGLTTTHDVSITLTGAAEPGAGNHAPVFDAGGGSTAPYTLAGAATGPSQGTYALTQGLVQSAPAGGIWQPVDLSQDAHWSTKMYFGPGSPGGGQDTTDGIAFAFQDTGATAIGANGGAIGIGAGGGIPAIANAVGVKFDTFPLNPGEPGPGHDFAQFFDHGAPNNSADYPNQVVSATLLSNGALHSIEIDWNAATHTLSYVLDGTYTDHIVRDISTMDFGGNSAIYAGFTGAGDFAYARSTVEIDAISNGNAGFVAERADQSGSAATTTITGKLGYTDADLGDMHIVGVTPPAGTLYGAFEAHTITDSTATGHGNIGWSFTVADGALDPLAPGETVTQVYGVTLSDGIATVTKPVTITLAGANDPPAFDPASTGAGHDALTVAEADGQTGVHELTTHQGTLAFSDAEAGQAHTVSSALAIGYGIGTFEAHLATDSAPGTPGSIVWSYAVADSDLDFLARGETQTETYQVSVDDGSATATKAVTITLTGTNDAPAFDPLQTGPGIDHGAITAGTTTASGLIAFTDVDLSDTHTVSWQPQGTASQPGFFGAFQTLDSMGGTNGFAEWTYKVDDNTVAALADETSVTLTYLVTVDDGVTSDTRPVTITLTGVNDAPYFSETAGGAATTSIFATGPSDPAYQYGGDALQSTDQFYFADPDVFPSPDTLTVALTGATDYVGTISYVVDQDFTGANAPGQISWTYSALPADLDVLSAHEVLTEVYTFTVIDENGGRTNLDLAVDVTGAPDFHVPASFAITAAAAGYVSGVGAVAIYNFDGGPAFAVGGGGDINHDGFADVVAKEITETDPGQGNSVTTVVFGAQDFNNSSTGLGFDVTAAADDPTYPGGVTTSGDYNGDGVKDLLVGVDPAASLSNTAFVRFGQAENAAPYPTFSTGDSRHGIDIHGTSGSSGHFAAATANAGDFNGDGIDDVAIGAPDEAFSNGTSYVYFGAHGVTGTPLGVTIGDASSPSYIAIGGSAEMSGSGRAIAGAGDFNNDGVADLVIGAPYADNGSTTHAGEAYVVFGGHGVTSLDTANLNGTNGFEVALGPLSVEFGYSVAGGGDFNGDGIADVIIGTGNFNEAYILFGGQHYDQNNTIGDLANAGKSITLFESVPDAPNSLGRSVAFIGDVNGDGFGDVAVGSPVANDGGGAVYVVFGTASGSPIDLSHVDGTNGFVINGPFGSDIHFGDSVAAAGDVNGDGFADFIVGSRSGSTSYVVLGGDYNGMVDRSGTPSGSYLTDNGHDVSPSTFLPTQAVDGFAIVGGAGNDVIEAYNDGDRALYGGAGNDEIILHIQQLPHIDGGSGTNALVLQNAFDTLDLTHVPALQIQNIQEINMTDGSQQTLRLSASDVFDLTGTADVNLANAVALFNADPANAGNPIAISNNHAIVVEGDNTPSGVADRVDIVSASASVASGTWSQVNSTPVTFATQTSGATAHDVYNYTTTAGEVLATVAVQHDMNVHVPGA